MPFGLASRVSQRSVSLPLVINRNEYLSRTLRPDVATERSRALYAFSRASNEDWLLVTATGRHVRRQNASALPPPASPCRHCPRERGLCHELQAPPQRHVRPLRSSRDAVLQRLLAPPTFQTRDFRQTPWCCHLDAADRHDALPPLGAMTVDVSATGYPITSMLPPRFGDATDHNRSESAKPVPKAPLTCLPTT